MERINNVEDVLRILETDYKILSVKRYSKGKSIV